jgi:hypothetical protein
MHLAFAEVYIALATMVSSLSLELYETSDRDIA